MDQSTEVPEPRAPANAADLRRARVDHGLSLRAAADEIGVSRGVIREAEAGARRPHPENARKIADFFQVAVSALWPEIDNKSAPAPLVAAGGTTENPVEVPSAEAR